MDYSADDMTATRPRKRLVLSIAAVMVPLIVLVGASVWFIRTYVLPPTVAIHPLAIVSTLPAPEPETTGSTTTVSTTTVSTTAPVEPEPVAAEPPPAVRYTSNSAEVWAAVPLPGPPRMVAPDPAFAAEPLNEPVPLPPRRPSLSSNGDNGSVPTPRRRRPAQTSN